jgi:hypothetical protein
MKNKTVEVIQARAKEIIAELDAIAKKGKVTGAQAEKALAMSLELMILAKAKFEILAMYAPVKKAAKKKVVKKKK